MLIGNHQQPQTLARVCENGGLAPSLEGYLHRQDFGLSFTNYLAAKSRERTIVKRDNIVRVVVYGILGIAAVFVLYRYFATGKANRLIDEVDMLVKAADDGEKAVGGDINSYLTGIEPAPDRAKLDAAAANASENLTKSVENFRQAAEKMSQAGSIAKSTLQSPKYYELMSELYQKRADAEEARRKAVALLMDKSIKSQEELRKQRDALIKEANNFERESESFEIEARKAKK
jgi:hypothetical protein